MSDIFSAQELLHLIKTVFSPQPVDKNIALIVDVPDETVPDTDSWQNRRQMVYQWYNILNKEKKSLGLENVSLLFYRNVHSNNADLPENCYEIKNIRENLDFNCLAKQGFSALFEKRLAQQHIIIAPTQFSATAPLKMLAKKHGFRAATMPGFSMKMIPALRLDWVEINRCVKIVKKLLDESKYAAIEFCVDNQEIYNLKLDLRFRPGHASGGLIPDPGCAGNLPSGESYIVPYEGELTEPSRSSGIIPVQFGDEIVIYRIEANKAVGILSNGEISEKEKNKLKLEPAYGNLAELGFGVLRPFGIQPVGVILIDEKLGLHIAFGRSDHFGGSVGAKDFNKPENVVHIDRIYIPETQPRIQINSVLLENDQGTFTTIIKDGQYTIFEERTVIGIVGGVGPYAGLDLAKKIFDQTIAAGDQEHLSIAILSLSAKIEDRTLFLLGEKSTNPAYAIADVIKQLEKIGAVVIGIPCNTAHAPAIFDKILNELLKASTGIKLLHMIEETGYFIKSNFAGLKNIGILSTIGTYKTEIYPLGLQKFGFNTIIPDKIGQNKLHNAIYNPDYGVKAKSNPVTDNAKQDILEVIAGLEKLGAEAVVLGCTEIPLAITENKIGNCVIIDPTLSLARALIAEVKPAKLKPLNIN